MTAAADDQLIADAAAAAAQGMQVASDYWQSAGQTPGQGMEVRLPSYPNPSIGRPFAGLSYDTPPEPAPLPGRPSIKIMPDYASDAVGGALHHGSPTTTATRSDGWLAGTILVSLPPAARSSVTYVSASMAPKSWPERVVAAIRRAFGRS
jgi:hypothetical protein